MVAMANKQYCAIVDYGLGNLFSIKNACDFVGIKSVISSDKDEILNASGLFLPGVGAFSDAITALKSKDLIDTLHQFVREDKPVIGICLGMQLLMSESFEFGHHKGLGFVEGSVLPLETTGSGDNPVKIPHIGWNRISRGPQEKRLNQDTWGSTPLETIPDGEFMYFIHSYYVRPTDENLTVATTRYGTNTFCSAIQKGNIFGMQFHPEKSGCYGLKIYQNVANMIRARDREDSP